MRPADPRVALLLPLIVATAAAALVRGGKTVRPLPPTVPSGAAAWRALFAARPRVALGDLSFVLLKTPSLAQRVAAARGRATPRQQRLWTAEALAAQRRLVARLAAEGVHLRPRIRLARVLDAFSADVEPGIVPLLERDPDVAGVYPVRVAYPVTLAAGAPTAISPSPPSPSAGQRSPSPPQDLDGRGVTVALLDTAVDRSLPSQRGVLLPPINVVGRPAAAEHGTELARLLVATAPAARVLPVRVAARQPDGYGGRALYARGDQLLAGLERAVDPNGDGDARDAARVALVGLAEPFAGFPDSPESRAVAGAAALGTLVVAPVGDDGPGAAGAGDAAAPASAAAALAVGAIDPRPTIACARVTIESGGDAYAATLPLAGGALPTARVDLDVAVPRGAGSSLASFFSASGGSLVAGRAALVPAGSAPADAVRRAASAGAEAVLVYGGGGLPAGALGTAGAVPVVSLDRGVALALRQRLAAGGKASVTLAPATAARNPDVSRVAAFSSTGALDGAVKPDLVAPGLDLAATVSGSRTGRPRSIATVGGTGAAAALVAAEAALLLQARPELRSGAARGLLVGTAASLPRVPLDAQGAGRVDLAAAVRGRVYALPATLALAPGETSPLTLTNVSPERLSLRLGSASKPGTTPLAVSIVPRRLTLEPGRSARLRVRVASSATAAHGAVAVAVDGAEAIRVPWTVRAPRVRVELLGAVRLSRSVFSSADTVPTALAIEAGRVLAGGSSAMLGIRALARLDVKLRRGRRRLGLLARLRDVLPGRYVLGLTGRGPDRRPLPPGRYVAEVVAVPVGGGAESRRSVRFAIR